MRPARHLDDGSGLPASIVQLLVSRIAIGLEKSAEAGEMRARSLALAVGRVEIGRCRRADALPAPVVAGVHPQPAGPGLAGARRQHRDRRVVGMDLVGCEYMRADVVDQRLEQPADLADPVRHGRAVEFDAFAGVDFRLPVEREVVDVLGHQHMREQAGACLAARDGQCWCWRLGDGVATLAGELGADVAHDLEAAGHILQHLGHVLAQRRHRPAARAAAVGMRSGVDDLVARQMVG